MHEFILIKKDNFFAYSYVLIILLMEYKVYENFITRK